MKRILVFQFFLLMSIIYSVQAQELPSADKLQTYAIEGIPGFWEISQFRIVASEKGSDPINPKGSIRFEADVISKNDLYVKSGEEIGPFIGAIKTLSLKESRTVYGTMQLSYRGGSWTAETNIENPLDNLGKPIDFFSSPTIELGSEKQKEVLELLQSDTISKYKQILLSEKQSLLKEHKNDLAELILKNQTTLDESSYIRQSKQRVP